MSQVFPPKRIQSQAIVFINFLIFPSIDVYGNRNDHPGIFCEHDIDFRRGLWYGVRQ